MKLFEKRSVCVCVFRRGRDQRFQSLPRTSHLLAGKPEGRRVRNSFPRGAVNAWKWQEESHLERVKDLFSSTIPWQGWPRTFFFTWVGSTCSPQKVKNSVCMWGRGREKKLMFTGEPSLHVWVRSVRWLKRTRTQIKKDGRTWQVYNKFHLHICKNV